MAAVWRFMPRYVYEARQPARDERLDVDPEVSGFVGH